MLRRTGFARKAPPPREATQSTYTPKPREIVVVGGAGRIQLVNPIPKGPPHKPGKRAPTVAEQHWMDTIVEMGCIACRLDGHYGTPAAVHHILRGGVRMGHLYTLPLCDPGHHQNGREFGKVSRHPDKAAFESRYGAEIDLLTSVQALVRGRPARLVLIGPSA